MKLAIRNGRVIDPATGFDAVRDVLIDGGRIADLVAAGDPARSDFAAARTIDATGLVVCPGLVDLAARLREPDHGYRATLESEIEAALAGGVTSLVCPPDTHPPLDEPGLVGMLKYRARTLNRTHVHPLGALTVGLAGAALTEMSELRDAGCIGFSQADVPIADTQVLLRALQYAQTFGFVVWWRPQDAYLGRGGVAASGPVAARLGLPSVPTTNETVALLTLFELLRAFGTTGAATSAAPRVHLCRLSSAAGLALVRAARAEGLPVTCDVGIHHVHLIDMDVGFFDAQCRIDPPLRGQRDRAAIHAALLDGTIDAICSDHAPVDDDGKLLPFGEAEPGATGLELLLPLTLKWAQASGLTLPDALSRVTDRPAAIVGQGVAAGGSVATGRIAAGGVADLCVFDPAARWTVGPDTLKSQGRNTPFVGYEMTGRVRATIVDGAIVHEAAG